MAEGNFGPQWWEEILSSIPLYHELSDLRRKGWENPDAESYFRDRRKKATDKSQKAKKTFYEMTQNVGHSLVADTKLLDLHTPTPRVLDLCMAPGGFSTTVKKELPRSIIDAVTLPTALGGYDVIKPRIFRKVIYADITMYCSEMGVDEALIAKHGESRTFEIARPFVENPYDLIFCGGAVSKEQPREEYRSGCEAIRLTTSQLVFALNRLKKGGSLVMLLFRIDAWHTVCILHALSKFSDIQVFKHPKAHSKKSSFYLVAKNVNLDHEEAKRSISYWRDCWEYETFKTFADVPQPISKYEETETNEVLTHELQGFGPRFLELARPLWEIQADALRDAPFNKSKGSE